MSFSDILEGRFLLRIMPRHGDEVTVLALDIVYTGQHTFYSNKEHRRRLPVIVHLLYSRLYMDRMSCFAMRV